MSAFFILVTLIAVFVGVSVGGNSAPKAAASLQCIVSIRYWKLALLVTFFIILGGLLQAGEISKTMGKGIINENLLDGRLDILASIFLTAGIMVFALTLLGIPASMSQIMVSAVLGVGTVMGGVGMINQGTVIRIVFSWILTPILSCLATYLIYRFFMVVVFKKTDVIAYNRLFILLTFIGAIIISYDVGANNVGVILGPLESTGLFAGIEVGKIDIGDTRVLAVMIGLMMGIGALTLGESVSYTLSKKITVLDPLSSFTSQFGAGIIIYFFIIFGMPVSIGQAIVGSVSGIGLVKGMHIQHNKAMKKIILCWILTPITSLILSVLIYRIFIIL